MGYLDSLLDTISDTGKGVVKKAKDITEVTKIAGQIADEEKVIKQAYLAIGKKYHDEVQGEVPDRFLEDFSRIAEAKVKILKLKEREKELKKLYECPTCGSVVMADARFCSSCGSKLKLRMQEEKEE